MSREWYDMNMRIVGGKWDGRWTIADCRLKDHWVPDTAFERESASDAFDRLATIAAMEQTTFINHYTVHQIWCSAPSVYGPEGRYAFYYLAPATSDWDAARTLSHLFGQSGHYHGSGCFGRRRA